MKLHEYQAKCLLSRYGVTIMPGYLAYTPKEAQKAAVNLGGDRVVVKAQVHAGGRGKCGGIKLVANSIEARDVSEQLLGMVLKTAQTGENGSTVRKVYIEQCASIKKESYLGLLVNREHRCVSIITSAEGGMEIEQLAEEKPEAIMQLDISLKSGLLPFHLRKLAYFLGIEKELQKNFFTTINALYDAFLAYDCELLEINPLAATADNKILCLDAKMVIDDNASYRQHEIKTMIDYDEIDSREIQASQCGLNYIALDGNIGCMVNGAGLAMATMDLIQQAGGMPANFLDVGGGATKEMVAEAFKIILEDQKVKAVLVNIFGGIMRCDVIAEGILAAAEELSLRVPLVVRLAGTNVEKGRKLLDESTLNIVAASDMLDAATKVVSFANDA